jgi:Zn-finger nucleic acid-binding protein
MVRPRPTEESRARAARIRQALADLLLDEPSPAQAAGPPRPSGRGCPCPNCGAPLQTSAERLGVEIDACLECGGIWLDAGELEQLTTGLDPGPGEGARDEAELRRRVAMRPLDEAEVRYRECPRCRDVMTRRNFGTISGVIVDECRRHGLFLDAGELEAVEAFLRAGGRALGEAARARSAARSMPPPPEPTEREVKARSVNSSVADMLWGLFFG